MTIDRPRPRPFEAHTTAQLWTDPHISKQMLALHLAADEEPASRPHAFIKRSIDWICQRFDVGDRTQICDFGCGPGLYTTELAERGAQVTGVDFSSRSLQHARQTAASRDLEIEYVCQDYLTYSTDRKYDLATLIYCDFCALSGEQRQKLLSIFRSVLKGDGTLLLDVFSNVLFENTEERYGDEIIPKGGFWSAQPYRVITTTHKYNEDLLLLDHYSIQQPSHTREIYNWLQCFTLDSLCAELKNAGFRVLEHYSNVAGDPFDPNAREIAVVAQASS